MHKGRSLRLLSLLCASTFILSLTPSALAAPVTASDSVCNQTVGNAAGVTATRLAGGDCVVTFTTANTTTWTVPAGITSAEVLVVGGGGGGGGYFTGNANSYAGGGGGGGVYDALAYPLTPANNISITVGAGGAAGQSGASQPSLIGSNGGSTSFGSLVAGGGGGGGYDGSITYTNGLSGTAGGGGGGASNYWNAYTAGTGGTGTSLTVSGTTYTGRTGGNGAVYVAGQSAGGDAAPGGGAGGNAQRTVVGPGISSSITETATVYGKGGGAQGVTGWTFNSNPTIPGTGGDGWAGTGSAGANGAKGIVIIRYTPIAVFTFAPASNTFIYRQANALTFTTSVQGKVTISANGKAIPACKGLSTTAANGYTTVCSYRPALHGSIRISYTFAPTSNPSSITTQSINYAVIPRSGSK
jgi:hypothetical protein